MPKIDIITASDSTGEMPELKSGSNQSGMPIFKNANSIHHIGDSIKFTKITREEKIETEDGIEIEKITEIFEEPIIETESKFNSLNLSNQEPESEAKAEQDFDLELTESKEEKKMQSTKQPEKKPKKKKLGKGIKITSAIFFVLYLIAACYSCINIFSKGLLPDKYLYPCIAVVSVISLLFALITFSNKCKKVAKTLCIVFETLLTAVFVFACINAGNVFDFLEIIKAGGYQIEEFYIIVKADSEYQTIDDLNSKTLATYNDPAKSYADAMEKINSLSLSLVTTSYSNFLEASTSLLEGNSDSLLLKAPLLEIVSESIPNLKSENIRIIHTIEVKTPINSEVSNINVKDEPFNVLITGIDTFGDIATVSRSDVNMVATINPNTHQILLTSIPRDYYVQLHGTEGLKDKLTHSGLYGADMTRQTIEDFMNIKINYFVRINFSTVINVVNAIGGITIYSDAPLLLQPGEEGAKECWFDYGDNYTDGYCALRFARERKSYGAGDIHRIQNQQEVLSAIINKVSSDKSILFNYKNLLNSMSGGFQTNIPTEKIYDLINLQLDEMPSWQIERINLTGFEAHEPTYTIPSELLYVFLEDKESINAATDKIRKTMYPEL